MVEKGEYFWSKHAKGFLDSLEFVVGKPILEIINKALSEEKNLGKVVDFGCGTGIFTKIIAQNSESVIAVDISEEMLNAAEIYLEKFDNIKYKIDNIENSSLPSNEFDCILLSNIIHIVESPHKALQECYRILKEGGKLLIIDYTGYGMKKRDLLKMGMRYLKTYGKPPKHSKEKLSPDKLTYFVEKAKHKVKKIELLGNKVKALYLEGEKITV